MDWFGVVACVAGIVAIGVVLSRLLGARQDPEGTRINQRGLSFANPMCYEGDPMKDALEKMQEGEPEDESPGKAKAPAETE